ncbi:hypothetical protein MMAN_41820 [Mycobacterium mantenii]|uniref:Pyridoxamine 5'-phosphate oxidase putative domain-containing protein n=1 Tax=Mycobacterium mantenii TaxID=560555 RepID=A0A1X0G024_MYCNT|nr:hypothetical protein [Mycobacterium mantenii]MCV7241578.1 hypothetical protein [Mycobacterium mantenii]ORB07108.1 hypothetical protein BST30_09145 [Mycobacterium mantenii]BBY40048.1 hypothetical protein MMAN_41820 [Mycobacterium mantenii]
MAEDELAEFLAQGPTGAICVVDANDQLLALPARVVDFDSATIAVTVDGVDVDAAHSAETQACVVADTFAAYRDIRGAIVQGAVMWPPASDDVAMLTVSRTVTFSFVNA